MLKLFKHKTIQEFAERGLNAEEILNARQGLLLRDYDVSDPARVLFILQMGIDACRDASDEEQMGAVFDQEMS
jgi:hypothetical protein